VYGQPPVYGQPQYAQPYAPIQPIKPIQPLPATTIFGQPGTVSLRPTVDSMSYDIPTTATNIITERFKSFRTLIPTQSCPAAVRAQTLAALENRDRTVQTGVCRDQYWIQPNLSKIYPWAAFQFLCIKDWKNLAEDPTRALARSDMFEPEWNTFLNGLRGVYDSAPLLDRGSGGQAKFLDQMRFTKVADIPLCKASQNPRVRFKEVQEGLQRLQFLHQQHVKNMWKVINDLIIIIQDPETKTEVVRLHPNVISSTAKMSSADYVKQKAAEARGFLAQFYVDVEAAYMDSTKALQVVE
jgi:hypothetical protein